ncbi:hypothetical protein F5X68DRAFT_174989 [Plectosphaerella plurivora]|uniref:ATPase synthesis protein 25 n=1 Tax=Plectosphaerella plurivora TaxID=936078 RepID=A0A9P8V4T1_9PEZI|nr:hypothetical protein F5X68DRAFT_174989 [Plectosphaerella plurivora]
MTSRPAAAALSCFQCRAAILRAVSSASLPALRAPTLVARPIKYALPIRTFATTPKEPAPPSTEIEAEASPAVEVKEEKTFKDEELVETSKAQLVEELATQEERTTDAKDAADEDDSGTPWYLDVEDSIPAPTQHIAPLPDVPEGAPALFEPLLKYIYEEMGLDDMELLDLREMEPPPALGPNLLMLFGTARSERHLHVSSSRMVKWLRYHYNVDSRADGLIGPGELKTKLRRLRKKAKLLGSSAVPIGEDDGISTGWICVNLGTIGSTNGEAARFDEDGKMTGFGTSPTGTTIVVQVMTEARRKELNLERLWSGQLSRSIEAEEALKINAEEFERRFGKKPPRIPRPRKLAPEPRNFGQKRSFSTGRVLATSDQLLTPKQGHLGAKDIGRAYSLLAMASQRGMPVLRTDILVTLISGLTLQASRRNKLARFAMPQLQTILKRGDLPCPTESQIQQLMTAYIIRGWLSQFWDAWQIPAMHGQSRSASLYAYVFGLAVKSERKTFCADALRRLVPEMLNEKEPVMPVGAVWDVLKACLLIADPGSEELAKQPAPHQGPGGNQSPRLYSEFVRMRRHLNEVRESAGLGV